MNAIAKPPVGTTEPDIPTQPGCDAETIREMCGSVPAEEILEWIACEDDPDATASRLVTSWVAAGYPERVAKIVAPKFLEGCAEKLSGLKGALVKAQIRARRANREIVEAQLVEGEKCLAFQHAEVEAPFAVRILPYVGEWFGGKRRFLLAVTDARLIIIEVKKPRAAGKPPRFKRLIASIPFSEVSSLETFERGTTSGAVIRSGDGMVYRFTNMLESAAEKLAADFRAASEAAPAQVAAKVPFSTEKPPRFPLGRICLSVLGAFTSLASLGGFSQGDVTFALLALGASAGFLWFGCLKGLFVK